MAFIAVQGNIYDTLPNQTEHVARLVKITEFASDEDSVFPTELLDDHGSGFSYEEVSKTRRMSLDRNCAKVSTYVRDSGAVMMLSKLKRTMADHNLLKSMGFMQDNTDADAPPPSDAELLAGHLTKMLAKQRWGKAHKAVASLRALKLGVGTSKMAAAATQGPPSPISPTTEVAEKPKLTGLAARLAAAGASPPESPKAQSSPKVAKDKDTKDKDTRERRISITALASSTNHENVREMHMGKLPTEGDIAEMCCALKGDFACVILDRTHKFVIAARSSSGNVPLYWGYHEDGALVFSSSISAFPEGMQAKEFPPGAFFAGRSGAPGLPKAFTEVDGAPRLSVIPGHAIYRTPSSANLANLEIAASSTLFAI